MRRQAIVVFARRPALGRVKTRLRATLTPRQALAFHVACLEATLKLVASLPTSVDKHLYLTGSLARVTRLTRRGLRVRAQGRGSLGARLARMFAERFAAGNERVVVIGSDSPALGRVRLRQALAALERADLVLGPTEDGGYYLLGCRRRAFAGAAAVRWLFRGIPWGSSRTFARTLVRARQAGLRVRLLPRGYDVDRPRELARLRGEVARRRAAHLAPLKEFFSSEWKAS